MDIEDIKQRFVREFGATADKFAILTLTLEEAKTSDQQFIWHPGVYVWWRPTQVVKVGRHLTNSRKRALEHIRDNTGGKMSELANDAAARLLLFNVVKPEDYHWVAALEIYFENTLDPIIPSQRMG